MSGLAYLQEGGEAEDASQTNVQIKPAASKGLPSLANNLMAGPGVLSAMEQLYQTRLANQGGFTEGMKDAAAWWSGGVEGPTAALSRRGTERRAQEENLFQLQAQIAQFRAAQEAQKRFEQRRASELGLGGSQSVGAKPGSVDAMFGMPPGIRQALANAKTEQEYNKIYNEYAKKVAEAEASPEFDVPKIPVVTWNEEAGEWQRDVISARQLRANPSKYFNEDGTQVTGAQAAPTEAAPTEAAPTEAAPTEAAPTEAAPSGDLTSEDMSIPGVAPQGAAAAPAAAQPTNYTFDELSPEQLAMMKSAGAAEGFIRDVTTHPDAAEFFNKQPLEKRKAIFDRFRPEPTQVAAAPSATATDVAPPSVGTVRPPQAAPAQPAAAPRRPPRPTAGQLERQAEVEKTAQVEAEKNRLEVDKKNRDLFVANIDPEKITERKVRADRAAQIVKNNPLVSGILSGSNYQSAVANFLSQGVSTPLGNVSLPGLSDLIYQTLPSTMNMKDRKELAGILANMELDTSALLNGQGQISDGERVIIRKASIDIEDPAEVVYKKAKMMSARQDTLRKLSDLYGDGVKYTRNFQAFRNSPEYKKINAEYENTLTQIANENVTFARPKQGKKQPATGTTKGGVKWKVVP
jgi:hypothetical protein